MAPGSIEDLQHYSTSPRRGLLPKDGRVSPLELEASGLSAHVKANPLLSSLPELDFPPSPALLAPSFPPFTPYVKTFEVDSENLRPGVTQDDARPPNPADFDVLRALKVTTYAIRSVRNYLLSLHNEHGGHTQPRQGFRPTSLSTSGPQKRRVFSGTDRTDSLTRVWHAALNVLTLLRELEESARDPLSDDTYDAGSDHSLQGRVASLTEPSDVSTDASFSVSVMHGRTAQADSSLDEEEDEFDVDESERLPWERSGEKSGSCRTSRSSGASSRGAVWREQERRGWVYGQERSARKETSERESRGKDRCSSAHLDQVVPNTEMAASERSARRVVSANMLDSMRDLVAMEEHEELQTLEEDGNEDEGDSDETSGMDDTTISRDGRGDVNDADNGGTIQQRTLAAARRCSDNGRTRAVTGRHHEAWRLRSLRDQGRWTPKTSLHP
ncbi:hypothetical protein EDB83DRAFT_2555075 [Lactarius deliciosus]|nr:hypothetical protein EDB83DRAFT_2555075 [Lactarius deliciosus]